MATRSNRDRKKQQGEGDSFGPGRGEAVFGDKAVFSFSSLAAGVVVSTGGNLGTPSMNAGLQSARSAHQDLRSVMPGTSQGAFVFATIFTPAAAALSVCLPLGNRASCRGRALRRRRTPSRIMLCCREPGPSTKGLGPPKVQHPAPAARPQPGTKSRSAVRAGAEEPRPAASPRPPHRPELPNPELRPAARNPVPKPKPASCSSRRAPLHPTASRSAPDVCSAVSLRPRPTAQRHPAVRRLVWEGGSVTRGRPAICDRNGSGPGPAARRRRGSGPSPLSSCCSSVSERPSGARSCPTSGPGPSSGSSPIHLRSRVIQSGPARFSSSMNPVVVLRRCSTQPPEALSLQKHSASRSTQPPEALSLQKHSASRSTQPPEALSLQKHSASRSSPSPQGPPCQSPPYSPGCGLQRHVYQNRSRSPEAAEVKSFKSEPEWHAVRMRASSPSPPGRYFLFRWRLAGGRLVTHSSSSPPSPVAPPSASSPAPLSSPTCPAAVSFPESPGRKNSPTFDILSGNTSSHFGGLASIPTASPGSLRRAFMPELCALDSAASGHLWDMENKPPGPEAPGL
ncbi:EZH inhibitory protein [Sorex araneus]|uniref:EZH inhibitory protein n=1 Tax=Sorex araneus TaxID=42254 RepID=UPI002433FC4F|nr:EZH inhibitory protein [Sorex araneus]